MGRRKRRLWIGLALLMPALLAAAGARPAYLWIHAWFHDKPVRYDVASGFADDASRLNVTPVAETLAVPAEPAAAESQLREILEHARAKKLRVALAGARHSMGGHTIYPEGIVVNLLAFNRLELDAEQGVLHAGAGARWSEVIPYLDAHGGSVAVMQSNNDFSIGGSLSVNCHGWQHNRSPIASTVRSFRLMKEDGTIVRCSREENAELFSLALGGYGLFGIILDAELSIVPNERYRPEVEVIPADRYVRRFGQKVDGADDIGMVYGRLCIVPGERTFLREAILTVFRRAPCKREELPALKAPGAGTLRREIYRAQIGSAAGKEVRWKAEKTLGEQIVRRYFSRNQLLDEGAAVYQEQNADRTDILHEYFVPNGRVEHFLEKARVIIPRYHGDLLNVTIRNVLEDKDTVLRYADQSMFAFVMLFNQLRTPVADAQMQAMTQDLIDAVIACGGRYYLPYRLHASPEQFLRAYPQAPRFFARKRHYDPEERFQNQFYLKYAQEP
jgi:FAD/FMN-containing dehydrogenase